MSLITPDLPPPRVIQVDTRGAIILDEQSHDVSYYFVKWVGRAYRMVDER